MVERAAFPGTLTINGNYTQTADGILEIELASMASFDKLVVNGTATLGGTLDVNLLGGFNPSSGMSFNILDWITPDGTFATLDLPTLTAGLTWNTSQLYTTGILWVSGASSLAGDYNQNGIVDAADYVVWRKGLVPPTTPNYNLWRQNFDRSSGAIANAAVPEPATLVLLASRRLPGVSDDVWSGRSSHQLINE